VHSLMAPHDKWVSKCTTLDMPCVPCAMKSAKTRPRLVETPSHAQLELAKGNDQKRSSLFIAKVSNGDTRSP
jgi:hypothetical protein